MIEAKFSNGVLTINLPKNPQAKDKGRRIEIKSYWPPPKGRAIPQKVRGRSSRGN